MRGVVVTPTALFTEEGSSTWRPTDFARGPWTPDALHGGPVAALLAHAAVDHLDDLQPARLTVEILRPVPVDAITVDVSVVRPGKRVRAVTASMHAGGKEVATATMLGIRVADVPVPGHDVPMTPPGPEHGRIVDFFAADHDGFHNVGVEHRFVAGGIDERGPSTDWIRLAVPLIEGHETRPIERVVAVADFGNGISRVVDFDDRLFINPDLTVYLHRDAQGEWICLDASSRLEPQGIGMAVSTLFDLDGPIGVAVQSLVVDKR